MRSLFLCGLRAPVALGFLKEPNMRATKLVTVEEHTIGEDRVFFGHQDHEGSEPLTAGTNAGWYWQCRGYPDAIGPFATRHEAEDNYEHADRGLLEPSQS